MLETIKETLGIGKKYTIKFGCDDRCYIVVNDKYTFGCDLTHPRTVEIPEKPYKIVAQCIDFGGDYGFKLLCTDEKGNVVCSTDDIEHWRTANGAMPKRGTIGYDIWGIPCNSIWGEFPHGKCTLIYYNPKNKPLLTQEQKKVALAFAVLLILLVGAYYAYSRGYIKIEKS
ncbi:hypothetical protein ACO3VM_09405 (plasmid) [Methanocaldococcus sp. 10A]